jgi:hypothetical protein
MKDQAFSTLAHCIACPGLNTHLSTVDALDNQLDTTFALKAFGRGAHKLPLKLNTLILRSDGGRIILAHLLVLAPLDAYKHTLKSIILENVTLESNPYS